MKALQTVPTLPPQVSDARAPLAPEALWHGVVPAQGRQGICAGIDLGVILLTGAAGYGLAGPAAGLTTPLVWLVTVVLALGAALAIALDRRRRGLGVGHRLLRLRTLDERTGLPALHAGRHAVTADLRKGRDPLVLVPAPSILVDDHGQRWAGQASLVLPSRVALATTDGTLTPLPHSTIVGRYPANPPGADHLLVGLTDLSRTMSKSHALLQPQGRTLVVTDLSSTNGTTLARPGEFAVDLRPHSPVQAPIGSVLSFGDLVVTVADHRDWRRPEGGI